MTSAIGALLTKRRKKKYVVYKCLFGYSEAFADLDLKDDSVDYVCFTDDPNLKSKHWKIILTKNRLLDSPRLSKQYKHLPHEFLGQYERSIYIDNTVKLEVAPSLIFERFSDALVVIRHPSRDCVYDEAAAVIEAEYDDPIRIGEQMALYRLLGYPEHNGLIAAPFILRNHNDQKLIEVSKLWHDQTLRFSFRDQLSWNVCAWELGFKFRMLDEDVRKNSMFSWPHVNGQRLPRDFDNSRYLDLHPDVKAANVNPRQHFLLHGFGEGRRYK